MTIVRTGARGTTGQRRFFEAPRAVGHSLGMRSLWLALALIGCNGTIGGDASLLCQACASDSDCNGNPCSKDRSGRLFCGAPCDSCPTGYSCQTVTSSSGTSVPSCYPDSTLCATAPPVGDMATKSGGKDGGSRGFDLANSSVDCSVPKGGTVSLAGGTVDRLFFGYTGDTRPSATSTSYPSQLQSVINNIYTQMGTRGVEFALDGGDHMEASTSTEASTQMGNYITAIGKLGKPVFMTMGNHECSKSFTTDCGGGEVNTDTKGAAFMSALKSTIGATEPYYRFDVNTNSGKAVFIVIADDAWDSTQSTWLDAQLTDADTNAKYTFVSKHHPDGNTDQAVFQTIYNTVTSHKYTLFMTGHSHEYKQQWTDSRAVVMGLGGAPFDNPKQMWWGYFTAMQCSDDNIYVTVYDESTGNIQDSWSVSPQ
jgi:hypothetical protein